jgi:choline dehydrogenase-like flavoprotein
VPTTRLLPRPVRRIIVRLAIVVCPPELRANRLLGPLLAEFALYLGALPSHLRVGVLGAFVLLDQRARFYGPARGRRFVDLDLAEADAYFHHMAHGARAQDRAIAQLLKGLITLCYYDLPEAQAGVGYRPVPYMAAVARRRLDTYGEDILRREAAVFASDRPGEQPRLPANPQPRHSRPAGIVEQHDVSADLTITCDVVIIGSGAGGASMAAELADAGIEVVVVEEGGYHPTESFTPQAARALRTLYRDAGAQSAIGSPPIIFSEGRCVGGSTVVNGGMCWRTPDAVLERWSRQEGLVDLTPEAMSRHFAKVERRINVAYQDPESIGADQVLLKAGADRLGWQIIPNLRNQIHCGGCNNCTAGCPTGAKRSMLVSYLPRALAGGARLFADCRVERITRRGKRATGVDGRFIRPDGRPGPRLTVRAGVVVSACGAIQTPALLWRSGFRSLSGRLGSDLTLHPNAKVVALFDEEVYGWQGVHQAYQVRQFMDEGILMTAINLSPSLLSLGLRQHGRELAELMQEYNRIVVAGCLFEDSTTGRVQMRPGIGPVASYQITSQDAARIVRGISLAAEMMFAAGARRVILPFAGAPDLYAPSDLADLQARTIPMDTIELVTVHMMGTARMSEDRRRGVVSSFGAFHDAEGLFVADASLFPGPIGINPMETILALVTRNAEWLVAHRSRYGI